MAVLTVPTDDEKSRLFGAYCLSLGQVAHAWNYLFENLGGLFVIVAGGNPHVARAIWYAPDSDRTKLGMLEAAIGANVSPFWLPEYPTAKEDIVWLAKRVAELTDLRNNAIHAPCILLTDAEGTQIAPSYNGHGRAKKLWGKEILVEFDWCERYAEDLSRFARAMEQALYGRQSAWPGRPGKPDRTPKKTLLSRLLPASPR